MEASSGKKVGENPQNEISHGASTKSDCHQLPQPTVDTGNNHDTDSDQGTELAENFPVHLTVSDLEVEISAGSSEGSGSQPVKEMPTGDPKSVSPRGAGKQDSWVQQVGKPAEHSDYHIYHSLPLVSGQDTAPNLLTEDFREAKEVYFKKLQEENKDLKKVVEKKAGEVKALQKEIEESSTRESEKNELIKKLQQMYQWKEGECSKLKEDQENQARQIEALENKVQDLEKETGQVEDLESKIESLEKQCEQFKTDNSNLHQNAMFLVKELREKTEELDIVSQYKQEIQNLEQFRDEVLHSLQDARTERETFEQLLEESAAREDENNELIRKLVQMIQWKEAECKKLKEDIQEQDQETLKGGEVISFVSDKLNKCRGEYQKRVQEEATQAFLKAKTNTTKKMEHMLAKEKQRVKTLKRSIAEEKIKRERLSKRNKDLCKRNRQMWARVNNLGVKAVRNFPTAGTSRCLEARDDEQSWSTRNRQLWARVNNLSAKKERNCTFAGTSSCGEASGDEQSWSTVSDEEETVESPPERRPSGT